MIFSVKFVLALPKNKDDKLAKTYRNCGHR